MQPSVNNYVIIGIPCIQSFLTKKLVFFPKFRTTVYFMSLIGLLTNSSVIMRIALSIISSLFLTVQLIGQPNQTIDRFYRTALSDTTAYHELRELCSIAPGRMAGTPELQKAIEYAFKLMKDMKLDTVYLQPVEVPDWQRGGPEEAYVTSKKLGKKNLHVNALGLTIGTGEKGLLDEIVEVKDFETMDSLKPGDLNGKIAFLNDKMNPEQINTFRAYSEIVGQRGRGAIKAAALGAKGVIIRSSTTYIDDYPHTGTMRYNDTITKIPALSISTRDADSLHRWLKADPNLKVFLKSNAKTLPNVQSYNVIGELYGSEKPDEIITVGGHIDAWYPGQGAQDDGAGCVHAMETLRLFKSLGIRPKHTLQAVLFVDEEIMQSGAKEFAKQALANHEKHIFALESDGGGFTPRGFSFVADSLNLAKLMAFKSYFEPYSICEFRTGYGGTDIEPLKDQGVILAGLLPDSQRYFEYHHSALDRFEAVNVRELQLGSATIASLIYLVDLNF